MAKVTLVDAINMALASEMARDPDVVLIGEDIGTNGGVFRATSGLQQRFGRDRVQDTPLAEGMIAGMAVGMAAQGLKVVAEIQFMGFIYPALDQIANHMARLLGSNEAGGVGSRGPMLTSQVCSATHARSSGTRSLP